MGADAAGHRDGLRGPPGPAPAHRRSTSGPAAASAASWWASSQPLLTTPGAFVLSLLLLVAGLLIAFDRPLRSMLAPATRAGQGGRLHAPGPDDEDRGDRPGQREGCRAGRRRRGRRCRARPGRVAGHGSRPWTRPARPACGGRSRRTPGSRAPCRRLADLVDVRARPGGRCSRRCRCRRCRRGPRTAAGEPVLPVSRGPEDVTDASDSPPTREAIEWRLPPHDLLDPGEVPTAATTDNADVVHARNEEIIVRKLASFDIEARIIGRNAGPVVTQYEVQPAPHIKLSRIEALAGRPGDGARGPQHPDRGADPGQERRRDRDPQQGVQHRRAAADPRRGGLLGVRVDA